MTARRVCFAQAWLAILLLAYWPVVGNAESWVNSTQPILPVITTRQLVQKDDEVTTSDQRGPLRFLEVKVQVRKIDALSAQIAELPVYVPDRWTSTEEIQELSEPALHNLLDQKAGRPVVYMHGYNEGFDKSVKRALWLRKQLQLENRLMLFSWPSDGSLLNYSRDEADLMWSVPTIAAVIESLAERYGKGGFDLIAHSLGGRGLSLALAQLYDQKPEMQPIAAQTVLVAPDMDVQIFQQIQQKVVANSQRLSLYVSESDEPLIVSETLHGYPRLGQSGVHTQALQGLDVIDVTSLRRRRPSGHNYHLGNPIIQGDIRAILQDKKAVERQLSAGSAPQHWRFKENFGD